MTDTIATVKARLVGDQTPIVFKNALNILHLVLHEGWEHMVRLEREHYYQNPSGELFHYRYIKESKTHVLVPDWRNES